MINRDEICAVVHYLYNDSNGYDSKSKTSAVKAIISVNTADPINFNNVFDIWLKNIFIVVYL